MITLKSPLLSFVFASLFIAIVGSNLTTLSQKPKEPNHKVFYRPANQALEPKRVEEAFQEIEYLDQSYGWAATDHSLWLTTDGGQSWIERRKAPTRRVSSAAEPYREAQVFLERIQVISHSEGWILEDSALLHTEDGGATWEKHDPKKLDIRSFRFVDKRKGWYIAQHLFYGKDKPFTRAGEIYQTNNGGSTWRKVTVDRTLEWTWLLDIWVTSRKHIWVVGDVILNSRDLGKTWREVDLERGNGFYGRPYRVKFIDSTRGWIKADGYLVTTDGGENWNPRSQEQGIEDFRRRSSRKPL